MTLPTENEVAIAGGGIAGLFCALILAKQGRTVHLFEASERLGGRISTVRLTRDPHTGQVTEISKPPAADADSPLGALEHYAEFGPMRVELDKQILLKALLKYLDIQEDHRNFKDLDRPCLVRFPAYASPGSQTDPNYTLRPAEAGKTPLQLLSLALLRIMLQLELNPAPQWGKFIEHRDELRRRLQLATATGEDAHQIFNAWVQALENEDYLAIQAYGCVNHTRLAALGFWNLLSDYLSHDAITKIRDLGTFYHLLPENPNAAEWLVWWLVGFGISDSLQGIFGGMAAIVERIEQKIKDDLPTVHLHRSHEVVALEQASGADGITLTFSGDSEAKEPLTAKSYRNVVLALPKAALEKLAAESRAALGATSDLDSLLDCAISFPMVKVFSVVRDRWWGNERMANRFATRVPTRELHYWPARLSDMVGMVMFYTDRPASAFWANYVPPGKQTEAFRSTQTIPGTEALGDRLKKKIVQYLNENEAANLREDDVLWYGIRDWGREPYGGANHCWRPERDYHIVMGKLGAIEVRGAALHVCGEAYSDYHGFIEGALRSAVYALHRILDPDSNQVPPSLNWLDEIYLGSADSDSKYTKALVQWVTYLDGQRKEPDFFVRN